MPISPRSEARIAGLLYVLVILLRGFAEIGGRQSVVVANDAVGTARAILAHQDFYRLGGAAEMITNVIAVPLTLILYRLLAPLTLLGASPDVAAIPQAQLAAVARLALNVA